MKYYLLLLLTVLPASNALSSVTLTLNVADLQNSSGAVTAGMDFGIVVDTGNDGFLAGSYDGFDITTNGQFLSTSIGLSDDWFVYGGTQGTGQTPPETVEITGVGDGFISTVTNIEFTSELSSGDEFAVMWFPSDTASSAGDDYGFFTDTGSSLNMVVPSDGGTSTKPEFVSTKSVDFQVVPEPSLYGFVGLLGFLWLVVRRRASI